MKNLAKSIVVTGSVVMAYVANASHLDRLDGFEPYVGIDAKWQISEGKNLWRHLLPKNQWGGTVYVGGRFWDAFGLELGYSHSAKKTKTHTFGAGEDFFNNGDTGGAILKTSNWFSSWHADVNGYWPLECLECLEFIGSVGLGWVKPHIGISVPTIAAPGINANLITTPGFFPQDANALSTIHGKYKTVLRLGVGAQFMIDSCWGIRGILRWETNSNLESDGNFGIADPRSTINYSTVKKLFNNSYSVAVGAFYKFF